MIGHCCKNHHKSQMNLCDLHSLVINSHLNSHIPSQKLGEQTRDEKRGEAKINDSKRTFPSI